MSGYRRLLTLATGATFLGAALMSLPGPAQAATAPPTTAHIATYQDQPVTSQGQTFFSEDIYVEKTGDKVIVSGSADGKADFYVDDLLRLDITHPDGSIKATTFDDSSGCTATSVLSTQATNIGRLLDYGVNKVHLTFSDACGGDYGNSDIWITGNVDFPAAQPILPAMDGGTRIAVINTNPYLKNPKGNLPGQACTSGFGVSAFGTTSYELTAKHCFDNDTGDQATNANIPDYMPVDVRTSDMKFAFAQELSCISGATACLLPRNNAKPSADVVAFRPNTGQVTASGQILGATQVTANIQTGSGVLPVLGETALEALSKDTSICHYGTGSYNQTGHPEQCGKSQGYTTASHPGQGVLPNLGMFSAPGFGGDSGGPAYVYSYGVSGQPNGVYILGLVIIASPTGGTIFIPVRDIEANLGVRLLTAPPRS